MFDRFESDFNRVLAGTTPPQSIYECSASYRDHTGQTHHTSGRITGETREAALQEFLTDADYDYEGCVRIAQSARIAPKE